MTPNLKEAIIMTTINTVTPAISINDVEKFLRYWWRQDYEEGYMDPIEEGFPKEAFGQSEPLWWDENSPKAQCQLGQSGWRAYRLFVFDQRLTKNL
jgi:hypothetical protein